jgi:hypothetical protein
MEESFDDMILKHLETAINELSQFRLMLGFVDDVEEMLTEYESLKNKFENNELTTLTNYEKDLSVRIGAIILKENYAANIHNTKSTYKLVINKNNKIKNESIKFMTYFKQKFNLENDFH